MSNQYSRFRANFKDLIRRMDVRSTPIKLIRHNPTPRQLNETTLEPETQTTTEIELVAVTSPYRGNIVDGTTVLNGDVRVMVDADDNQGVEISPLQDDNVLLDGDNYSIINIREFNPGGELIGWELQVRR